MNLLNAIGNLNAPKDNDKYENTDFTDENNPDYKTADLSPNTPPSPSGDYSAGRNNIMADVLARHEAISNRVRNKDGR